MSIPQVFRFVDYTPAQLYEGKEWYIGFLVKNPFTGQMARKKVKCNRIRSITERRRYARIMVDEINTRLRTGWNPFMEEEAPKGFYRLSDVLNSFKKFVDTGTRRGEFRPDSRRTYNSYIDLMQEWLTRKNHGDIFVLNFSKVQAREYLNDAYNEKEIKPRTYNNYLKGYRRIWNWMKENEYVKSNPWEKIPRKTEQHKSRIQEITPEIKAKITAYLEQHNPRFKVCCLMAYHCLIRPKEITMLRVGDIDLVKQQIHIPATVSKNKKTRYATIPDVMLADFKLLNLEQAQVNDYIFSVGLMPGTRRIDGRVLDKIWTRMRNDLGLPNDHQFYSLRDSGIIQKIRDGIPLNEIMHQADHFSLEVTNVYVRIAKPEVFENIRKNATKF